MVKGISRQVILVQSPEPKLFEQAIFILKDERRPRPSFAAARARRNGIYISTVRYGPPVAPC